MAVAQERARAQLHQPGLPAVRLSQIIEDGARTKVFVADDLSGEIVSKGDAFNASDDHSMTAFQDEAVNRIAVALHRRRNAAG